MTKQIEEKVFSYIKQNNMLQPGDCVVVGVSGGADSVCLLFLLWEYAQRYALSLKVVHVHHGIRKEADEEADYVKALCDQLGIVFCLVCEDIPQRALSTRCSLEEAGREARYEAFYREAGSNGKIAIAHNAQDNAETMCFHLFRGTGTKGMCGIRPVRDNIIRPILCLTREEIEEYLTKKQICWKTDKTNLSDDYTRNQIRHHILPKAQTICPGALEHMNQFATQMIELEDYLQIQIDKVLMECLIREEKKYVLDVSGFLQVHPALRKRAYLQILSLAAGSEKDLSAIHASQMEDLVLWEGNRRLYFPKGVIAERSYDKVEIYISDNAADFKNDCMKKIDKTDCTIHTDQTEDAIQTDQEEISSLFSCEIMEREEFDRLFSDGVIPENTYTKWFDYDKIGAFTEYRTRQKGDYLILKGSKGALIHKSVKEYMINQKIPSKQRDLIPMVVNKNLCIWLVGYRISETCKITDYTTRVVKITYQTPNKR